MDRHQLPMRGPVHLGQYPDSNKKPETVQIILYKDIEVTKIVACRSRSRLEYSMFFKVIGDIFLYLFIVTLHLSDSTCLYLYHVTFVNRNSNTKFVSFRCKVTS